MTNTINESTGISNSSKEKLSFWTQQYKHWEKSDKTQKKFCSDEGLSFSTFKYWTKSFVKKNKSEKLATEFSLPGFCAVEINTPAPIYNDPITIEHRKGFLIRVTGNFCQEKLQKILECLARI